MVNQYEDSTSGVEHPLVSTQAYGISCVVRGCFLFVRLLLKHDTCVHVCFQCVLLNKKTVFVYIYMNIYRIYVNFNNIIF